MEFLIKRTDGDWFNLHSSRFDEALLPSLTLQNAFTAGAIIASRLTDARYCSSTKTSASSLASSAEISPEKASSIVDEIAEKVSAVTGQSSVVIQLRSADGQITHPQPTQI